MKEGYIRNKQSFWDLLFIRYGGRSKQIRSQCACCNTFNLQHALLCPKGGFVTLRHNHIQNTTANLLTEVCKDVLVEPQLQPLSGETFSEKTANKSDQAWVDISEHGFWLTGSVAFLDVRVFNPTAKRYVNQELRKSYEVNEKEKKKQYIECILQVEHGIFTPLVMSVLAAWVARLSEMISRKQKKIMRLLPLA